jgi:formylglycine-generating enzyme
MKWSEAIGFALALIMTAESCAEGEVDPNATGGFKNCIDGATQCMGNNVLKCNAEVWEDTGPCIGQTCTGEGVCAGECAPNQKQCKGTQVQECMDGSWSNTEACAFACNDGACSGECVPGTIQCNRNMRQTCSAASFWKDDSECTEPGYYCFAGECKLPVSCDALANNCGPAGNENCCLAPTNTGETYNRINDVKYPATVTDYRLDRFEVTVGRFRKFVDAYPNSKPKSGAGVHPLMLGSGWDPNWDVHLPQQAADLTQGLKCSAEATWTDVAGANELLPINCVDWYVAFAFCAWDGGRLPTESEWNHAAAGGSEQREYPWSNPANSATIDATYAVYNCEGDGIGQCAMGDILQVASKSPQGDGKWGQTDLAGSMWEWTVDRFGQLMTPCKDCANLTGSDTYRVVRGGGWVIHELLLLNSARYNQSPNLRQRDIGVRCARNP